METNVEVKRRVMPSGPPEDDYLARLRAEFKPAAQPPGWGSALEGLLKHPARLVHEAANGKQDWTSYLFLILFGGALFYGLVVGAYSGGEQLWAAPVKFTFGLLASMVLTFPSLYVFTCVSGADLTVGTVRNLMVMSLALTVLLLAGFAPVAWVFSQTTQNLVFIGWIHLVFWCISLIFGIRLMSAGFSLLTERFTGGLAAWIFVFVLVSFQMTAVLRPLIGTAPLFLPDEKVFFLTHWFRCMAQ